MSTLHAPWLPTYFFCASSTPYADYNTQGMEDKKIRMRIRFLLEGEKPRCFAISLSREKTKARTSCGSICFCCFAVPWMAAPHLVWFDKGRPAKSPGLGENPPCGRKGTLFRLFLLPLLALFCARGAGIGVCRGADGLGADWNVGVPHVLTGPTGTWDHPPNLKQANPKQICKTNKAWSFWGILPQFREANLTGAKIPSRLFPCRFQQK